MMRHAENQQPEGPCNNQLEDLESREQSTTLKVDPLWKRLQNLEVMVTELTKKPSKIPLEKENMLHESLNRIKSIEYDLQKTKRVRKSSFKITVNTEEGGFCFKLNLIISLL